VSDEFSGYTLVAAIFPETLSKLHHGIKKSYFLLILSHQTLFAVCRIINKTNRHIPARMNQPEAIRAGTVSGLRAGRTVP
jgi:hypothetical protein